MADWQSIPVVLVIGSQRRVVAHGALAAMRAPRWMRWEPKAHDAVHGPHIEMRYNWRMLGTYRALAGTAVSMLWRRFLWALGYKAR